MLTLILLSGCSNNEHSGASSDNQAKESLTTSSYTVKGSFRSGTYLYKDWKKMEGTYKDDIVPDQKSAEIIAQAIFETIREDNPWEKYVFYDEEDETWIVSFGEDKGISYDGRNLDIALQKKDGKILRIWLT